MIKVKVTAPITLHSGLVGMDAEQLSMRKHCVSEVEKREGVFEINQPVFFKAGLEIELEEIPRSLAASVEEFRGKTAAKKNAKKDGK